MNQRSDKQYFLELNNSAFNLPRKFEFQAHKGDEVSRVFFQPVIYGLNLKTPHAMFVFSVARFVR